MSPTNKKVKEKERMRARDRERVREQDGDKERNTFSIKNQCVIEINVKVGTLKERSEDNVANTRKFN